MTLTVGGPVHAPIERTLPDEGYVVDCACGHLDTLWSHPVGARQGFLAHVAQEVRDAAGWSGSVDVEYDEDPA